MADRLALFTGGGFADSHAKTAHGILRYGPREVVVRRRRRRGRAASLPTSCPYARRPAPIVAGVADAAALGANVLVIGVAPFGGALTDEWRAALLEAIAAGMDVEAGLHTVLAEDPELSAAAARAGVELRDLRAAPPGPERADRRAARRARRAHRRLGLRDREDVGDAGAGRRRARARPRVRVRRHRADRDRDHRLGDRGRPRDLRLRRGRGRAAGRGGRGARAAAVRRGPGRARAPGLLRRDARACCTAASRTCWCSATARARPRSTTTRARRSRRCPSWSTTYERAAGWVRPARVAAIALNTRGLDDDAARAAIAARAPRRPACPSTIPCASAARRCSTRSYERAGRRRRPHRAARRLDRARPPGRPRRRARAARVPRRAVARTRAGCGSSRSA